MALSSIISVDNVKTRNPGDLQLLPYSSNNAALKVSSSGEVTITKNLIIPTTSPGINPPNGSIWLS